MSGKAVPNVFMIKVFPRSVNLRALRRRAIFFNDIGIKAVRMPSPFTLVEEPLMTVQKVSKGGTFNRCRLISW
jgi:hypothetical protein